MSEQPLVEQACEVMHDAYERAAVGAGWGTNPASRKPWAEVPEANKATMRAAVLALLQWHPLQDALAVHAEVDRLRAQVQVVEALLNSWPNYNLDDRSDYGRGVAQAREAVRVVFNAAKGTTAHDE